jgi:uncharacterized protein YutE (UPF0331/DUF86 family)
LWIIERGIFLSIQNILDLFAHIIAADLSLRWDSYAEIAVILFQKRLISKGQKDMLIKMTGLRNRLSHDYLDLDLEILIDIINNRIISGSSIMKKLSAEGLTHRQYIRPSD